MLENNITQVYKWHIETEIGAFTGTSLSMTDVIKKITMFTNKVRVLKKSIIPIKDKIYTWNVVSENSQASGTCLLNRFIIR